MSAKLNRTHKITIALVALVALGLLLAVGVWAYDDAQKDHIASGIKIGGVDVGGRSADSARKIIKREVVKPLQQPVVVTYDGKSYTLTASQLHPTADIDGMVQEAIDRSREGNILDRVSRYASGGVSGRQPPNAGQVRQEGRQGLRQPPCRAGRSGRRRRHGRPVRWPISRSMPVKRARPSTRRR